MYCLAISVENSFPEISVQTCNMVESCYPCISWTGNMLSFAFIHWTKICHLIFYFLSIYFHLVLNGQSPVTNDQDWHSGNAIEIVLVLLNRDHCKLALPLCRLHSSSSLADLSRVSWYLTEQPSLLFQANVFRWVVYIVFYTIFVATLWCSRSFLRMCIVCVLRHYLWGGGFFIYIKLGILSLCTEPWHGTRSISISWDFCLYWKAIWWIDYVYRYWLWIHTHLSTTFNLTLNCSLILTHARRSDQYCSAYYHMNCCDSYNFMAKFN